MKTRLWLVVLLCALLVGTVSVGTLTPASAQRSAAVETRLLRFPDISKTEVVFVYAGDLWIAPRSGGEARRLTAHPGDELYPKFSPDGKWIAFTG